MKEKDVKIKGKKNPQNKKTLIIRLSIVFVSLLAVVLAVIFITSLNGTGDPVIYSYTCEAGDIVSPSVFTYGEGHTAVFPDSVDMQELTRVVGEHKLTVKIDDSSYNVTLIVRDTVAPVGKTHNVVYALGQTPDAEDLVTSVTDKTAVNITFAVPPNMAVEGREKVRIKLTDAGGNVTLIDDCFVYVCKNFKNIDMELGDAPKDLSEFCDNNITMSYVDVNDLKNVKIPGVYSIPLSITSYGITDTYYAKITVADTTPPVINAVNGAVYDLTTEFPEPSYWLTDCYDATEITYSYSHDYYITDPGVYYIDIIAVDAVENKSEITVKVTALDGRYDQNAPIITVASELNSVVGNEIDFSKVVSVYDDKDGAISLQDAEKISINVNDLNIYLPGVYTAIITARDSSGKSSTATVTVNVIYEEISDEEMDELTSDILSSIITSGMSISKKTLAVYNKISLNDNMDFTGVSAKTEDEKLVGYYGFALNYGDSYTTACMMKLLLSELDIDSIIVTNSSGKASWLLVDFGDGWYHVDPFPHLSDWEVDGNVKQTYKLTDAECSDFTAWYNTVVTGSNYYKFNTSLYPATPVYSEETGTFITYPYTVIFSAGEGGYLEGVTKQSVRHGGSITSVTAMPKAGYKFVSWSDGVTTPTRTDVVKNNISASAIFEESGGFFKKYIFSYSAGQGGKLTGSLFQSVDAGNYGTTVVAVPDTGYVFAGWSDGVVTANRSDFAREDITVTANFKPEGNVNIFDYKASAGGKIEGEAFQYVDNLSTGKAVTAVPDEGYVFVSWSDGVITATRKDVFGADISVTARFLPETATIITVKYTAGKGGSINGIGVQLIEEGKRGSSVTAVPDHGYTFVCWSDGLASATRSDISQSDIEFTATFAPMESYSVIYAVSGAGGYIDGESNQTVFKGESATKVTAVALEGYKFIGWSDGVKTAERTDKPTKDILVTANFEAIPKHTITYKAGEGGSLSGTAIQSVYEGAESTTITAVASKGYKFVSWSDGSTVAARSDTMGDKDIVLEATFVALKQFTATYTAGTNGIISGTTTQTAYEGEKFSAVIAIANENYEFSSWSDGVTTPGRSDLATGDINVTATFVAKKPCTINYYAAAGGKIEGGDATQILLYGSRTEKVTAVPDEGFEFVIWSDGVLTSERSDILTETSLTLTAEFKPIE